MFRIIIIVFFIAVTFLDLSLSLVELPEVQENDILRTEAVIRGTANELFSILKIKEKYFKSPLEQYFIAHNYFISTTLQDYVSLNEIARLTRVDNTDLITTFIDTLNEILDESTEVNEAYHNDDVFKTIDHLVNDIPHATADGNEEHQFRAQIVSPLDTLQDEKHIEDNEIDLQEEDYDAVSNESFIDSEVWVPQKKTRRIYEGTMTKIKHYPFMAIIQLFNQFYCAGSIIAADLVITAASCVQLAWNNRFFRENPAFLSVRVGSTFYTGGGEVINVGEVYFHPTYNPKNLKDNICVLRLVRSLKFGKDSVKRRIKRIEIDRSPNSLPLNTDGIVIVGWGARDSTNNIKSAWINRLSYSVLDIYPNLDCRDVYSKEYVGRTNFCAGFISRGSGACNRDVGAPGVVGGFLVGVVSFGSAVCGTPDYPTVFTKVGFYADWIDDILDMNVPTKMADTTVTTPFTVTPPIYIATTTIVLRPLGDADLVEEQTHTVLRNRYSDNEDGTTESSKTAEISGERGNPMADNTPVKTTSFLSVVSKKKRIHREKESRQDSKTADDREPHEHVAALEETEEKVQQQFQNVWGHPQGDKEVEDYGEVHMVTPKTNTDVQTKLPDNFEAETTIASRILEDSTEFKSTKPKIHKKKKKKIRKQPIETTTIVSVKKKKSKSKMISAHKNTDESDLDHHKKDSNQEIKPKAKEDTTTVPDNPVNPLDTLSQKEFYALLAEVLDKLERDNSKDLT